ncbi:MAG: MarR family transcriptional regulator [Alphaproteobacteria bacterium]|nr:MarR family transcriptional regulator [Alphaproteobacteria bacterium]
MIEDERYFGFLVSDVARLLRTEFDRRVRRVGLTRSQWLVVTRVYRRPGCSQSELADMMEVEKATAGRLLDRLEDNGWIRRQADPNDRRIRRVHLTAEASRVHRNIQEIAHATVDDALSDLDGRERERISDLLLLVKGRLLGLLGADVPKPGNGVTDEPGLAPLAGSAAS